MNLIREANIHHWKNDLNNQGLWDLGMEDSNVEKLHYALLLLKYVETQSCRGPSKNQEQNSQNGY